jgi:4'-phosphopantetheinyl transferase EntD
LIERIVPPMVRVVEGERPPQDVSLFPEESVIIRNAVEKRRRDFRAGRACAHLALAALGVHDVAIASGPRREPLWPPGIVGSITHCPGYVAAAVAFGEHLPALGIDAEQWGAAGSDLESFICTPAELDRYRDSEHPCWRTLVFSAKESLFKALYPLRHFELEFADVEVFLKPDFRRSPSSASQRFSVSPARELGSLAAEIERIQGRFLLGSHHIFTAAWLPPDLDARSHVHDVLVQKMPPAEPKNPAVP